MEVCNFHSTGTTDWSVPNFAPNTYYILYSNGEVVEGVSVGQKKLVFWAQKNYNFFLAEKGHFVITSGWSSFYCDFVRDQKWVH